MNRNVLVALVGAIALTLPWIGSYLAGTAGGFSTVTTVAVSGLGVLGASFLLTWGAETAEEDVPRAFAIAVLAILAVAPEYAVDALYAWDAGKFAGTPQGMEAGNLAVANMTGANRILIGVGWAGIALFTIFRAKDGKNISVERRDGLLADVVVLDRNIGLEIVFLLLATLWAFLVPINGGIDVLDTAFLVGLYVAYIVIVLRADRPETDEHVGVPKHLQAFPRPQRVATVLGLFAYSGVMIFTAVEPFAHGLEQLGTDLGIPSFFMIQWLAPLASESPELIVVVVLVLKSRSTAGFNALISSKLNQWTLLIGTIAVVYSLALGQYGALPFDQTQMGEIWITAGQSFFAVALIINFELSAREAIGLFVLFISQVAAEFLTIRGALALPVSSYELLVGYTAVYILLGGGLLVARWESFSQILTHTSGVISEAVSEDAAPRRAD